MNILITGANGYLGKSVTNYLLQTTNFNLFLITRDIDNKIKNHRIKYIECDIYNKFKLSEHTSNIDIILHFSTSNYEQFNNNSSDAIDHTFKILNSINYCIVKNQINYFYYFSSIHVYGSNNNIYYENSELNPTTNYGNAHMLSENIIKYFAFTNKYCKYLILRLSNIFGSNCGLQGSAWNLFFPDIITQAYHKSEIILKTNGGIYRDFLPLNIFCKILSELINRKYNDIKFNFEIFNLTSGESHTLLYYINILKNYFQYNYKKYIKIVIDTKDFTEYKPISYNNDKILNLLNFKELISYELEIENIIKELNISRNIYDK